MSSMTAESILPLIAQLSQPERAKLRVLLDQQAESEQPAKVPRDKRLTLEPMRDCSLEMQWIAEHAHQYANQWVALDGDRLIAASHSHDEVAAAVDADGADSPLFHYFEDPAKTYAGF